MIAKKRFKQLFVKKKRGLTLVFLRILLAAIIFSVVMSSKDELALYLFGLAAFAAFIDGFLAKKNRTESQLRTIFDSLADKLLVNLIAIALFLKGALPLWVMTIYLAKDAVIIIGALMLLLRNTKTIFSPNAIDKISLFAQVFTLFIILLGYLDYVLVWLSVILVIASLISTAFKSGIRVVTYKTDLEEIRFTKLIRLPDIFTLLNVFMGLLSIILTINEQYSYAVSAMILAVVFDVVDGKVARLVKRNGDFGKQLDSLADTISFGVAPAIFGFALIKTNIAVVVFALFLFAGVLRLARYNIMEFTQDFAGMPITVNGVLIPLIFLAGVPTKVFPYIYLVLAVLMVSPIRIKRLF